LSSRRWALPLCLIRWESLYSQQPADQFARQVLDNELQAEQNDHSYWMLRVETEQSGNTEISEVVQRKDGDLDWVISVNGQALSDDQQRERERGLERLTNNPAELQKSRKEKEADLARSQRLLKITPRGPSATDIQAKSRFAPSLT
jgi:hypothetical protein